MPRIVTTLDYAPSTNWSDVATVVDVGGVGAARLVWRVVRAGWSADLVVVGAAAGMRRDPLAAAVLRVLRPRLPVMMIELTWKRGVSRPRHLFRRIAARLLDSPRTFYGVTTEEELAAVPRTWGYDPARVFYLPHYVKLPAEWLDPLPVDRTLVFGGGHSVRDWPTAIEAARGARFDLVIAARRLDLPRDNLPPNVSVREVPSGEFIDLMRRSAVVLIALQKRDDRCGGQQVLLTAMEMGKPVVVTDAFGIATYTAGGTAAFLVPPDDPAAMRARIEWVLDPANAAAVGRVAGRAREVARSFSPEHHVAMLIGSIEWVLDAVTGAAR